MSTCKEDAETPARPASSAASTGAVLFQQMLLKLNLHKMAPALLKTASRSLNEVASAIIRMATPLC